MFDVAVDFKAINGVLEIAGGYFLVFKHLSLSDRRSRIVMCATA
jgi:hypothetical protein